MDEFGLSQAVISNLLGNPEILEIPPAEGLATGTFEDPYSLLVSLGYFRPNGFNLVFLDLPRASKRNKVQLPTLDSSGKPIWSEVGHDDPDYLFRLTANSLAVTRLASKCLASDGILLTIVTPDTYLPVRTSIEQLFGHNGFLGELVYQTRTGGANDSKYMDVGHETLLVYAVDPSRVSRFQIEKDPEELQKYSNEDQYGRYYWDTYIRKQARNYYRIECPDGSFLEKDEFGNRISWLWKEKTFLQKLADGEVKFEKPSGEWRLYYKDRLKEFKILRSLVLNDTELIEISPEAPPSTTGAGLLTQRGSAEIKEFAGQKPEYLKSSEFFRFILSVFGRNKRVLIPFNDYGAATYAQLEHSDLAAELFTNNRSEHEELVHWRVQQVSKSTDGKFALFSRLDKFDVTSLESDDSRIHSFLQSLISNIDYKASDWYQVYTDVYRMLVAEGDSLHLLIQTLSPDSHQSPAQLLADLDELEFNTVLPVTIWSTYNDDVIRASFPDLKEFKSMTFPFFLL